MYVATKRTENTSRTQLYHDANFHASWPPVAEISVPTKVTADDKIISDERIPVYVG